MIEAPASNTVLMKFTRTSLTQGNAVRFCNPGKLERLLSLNDRLLTDNLLTPSFFVDRFKDKFRLLRFYTRSFENCSACFFLAKCSIDFVVFVLRGFEIRRVSDATFGLVRIMLVATFHLFVLSRQTLRYKNDENKNNGNLRMQNVTCNENSLATMHEENPTSLYALVHLVNSPISIRSNITESLGNDSTVFFSSGFIPE